MKDVVSFTRLVKNLHKLMVVWAAENILCFVGLDVPFLHAGKQFVQLCIEVFSVALAKCHSHIEA